MIFFFDLCRCSINTQIGNNATRWKRCRFRFHSNINEPLVKQNKSRPIQVKLSVCSFISVKQLY